jgi:hypothetical protein
MARAYYVVAAILAAVLLGAVSTSATTAAVARFQERQAFFASEGDSSSQSQVWRTNILVSGTTKVVGRGVWGCTRVASDYRCHGSYVLQRGTIEVAGVYASSRSIMYMAIVGGTGVYSGADGAFSSIGSLTFRDLTFAFN